MQNLNIHSFMDRIGQRVFIQRYKQVRWQCIPSHPIHFAFFIIWPWSIILFPNPLTASAWLPFWINLQTHWRFWSRDLLCPSVFFPDATILENETTLGTRLEWNLPVLYFSYHLPQLWTNQFAHKWQTTSINNIPEDLRKSHVWFHYAFLEALPG